MDKDQGKVFFHMKNVSASEQVANKKKLGRVVDLALSLLLDLKVSDLQNTLLNPTSRYVMLTEILDQSREKKSKKKESKLKQCFMIGDINSYSIIMNDRKGLEKI